ncbi:hypothetical protein SNE40_004319 [Patella caerulea]|uniref:Syntaxin-7 n=1 Tax=Patella caerulea TaxID=87958 RepID=A0AAN8K921_PATCE
MASYGKGEFDGIDSSYQSSRGGVDNTSDHNRLSQRVGNGIQKITQNVGKIKKFVAALGTHSDTDELRENLHDTISNTKRIAEETNKSIKEYARQPAPSNVEQARQFKMQKERLAEEFGIALKEFQGLQRTAAEKEKASVKRARAQSGLDDNYGINSSTDSQAHVPGFSQTRQVLEMEQDVDLDIIREREQSIKKLETDITDVNQIFKDLGMLIHEQGDVLDSIEANIDSSHINVQEGTQQLSKARNYQSKARRKKCICLIILLVVLIIIGIIVGVTVNKNS